MATPDREAPDLAGVVRYGFTTRQFALANARFFRSPRSALAFGLLFLVLELVNWLLASDAWIWLGCLVLGVCVLTGLFAVPFALWSIRKRRDLLADLQLAFDGDGIRARWVAGESDIRWAGNERISRSRSSPVPMPTSLTIARSRGRFLIGILGRPCGSVRTNARCGSGRSWHLTAARPCVIISV